MDDEKKARLRIKAEKLRDLFSDCHEIVRVAEAAAIADANGNPELASSLSQDLLDKVQDFDASSREFDSDPEKIDFPEGADFLEKLKVLIEWLIAAMDRRLA